MRAASIGAMVALALMLGVGVLRAAELKLSVDWAGVTLDQTFPVTGGVPFERGALKGPESVRILANGRELPLQAEVLAVWPDKSVKWLLLQFPAVPGVKEFTLEYGEGVTSTAKMPQPIQTSEADGAVTVDTGFLKFTVRKDGCGFIDTLRFLNRDMFDATGKRFNVFDMVHTETPADYHPMNALIREGFDDPSKVVVDAVTLEKKGPIHAVVRIDGRYTFQKVGSTIDGTDVKGDCPFRVRVHAYSGQSFLKVEHFFVYEGDGDRDFAKTLALRVGLPDGKGMVRIIDAANVSGTNAPAAGIFQETADAFTWWTSEGRAAQVQSTGRRFEGVLDVVKGDVGVAIGIKDFWKTPSKSLHADLNSGVMSINLWAPEAPPLDFRRHAREWSVGETGTPNDPKGTTPAAFSPETHANYRLASKGVGRTHVAVIHFHPAGETPEAIRAVYTLVNHRPLLFAAPAYYAGTFALGKYRERVAGEHDEIEKALDEPIEFWKFSQDHFRWYDFWAYGNVVQQYNRYIMNGRWDRNFGRWGWANGDSVGRLAYALMLQTVRKCTREDFEFAEAYLHEVHDACSTHTPAYPHHYGTTFNYVKGAAHRHGAWLWACPYVGARGAHPVGAKIYYFLTGEGHAKDILDEITELAVKNPHGGEGDGPLGPNAQIFLYQWEATGDDSWRERVKKEIDSSEDLKNADSGWLCMMNAAFGILNAVEEYQELTGSHEYDKLLADYAERSKPENFKNHWTWGGYYRVYSGAYNVTGDAKYRGWIDEMLTLLNSKVDGSVAFVIPRDQWPGPTGGPPTFVDGNIVRDVPFALWSLHNAPAAKEDK